jgi:NDP-sugar pyrophosphorylase family protein
VHNYPPFNRVEIDQGETIVGIRNQRVKTPLSNTRKFAFTGIHIISPEILEYIPPHHHLDIINLYLELISRGEKIGGYPVEDHYWLDIGTPNDYHRIHRDIYNNSNDLRKAYDCHPTKRTTDATGTGVSLEGYVSLGDDTMIGKKCTIRNSIIWDEVTISDNVTIEGCIIGNGVTVKNSLKDAIVV